jgi:hypothetical protein
MEFPEVVGIPGSTALASVGLPDPLVISQLGFAGLELWIRVP